MSKIVEYQIVQGKDEVCLADQVQKFLGLGWQPYENPFVNNAGFHLQAMVKYKEANSDPKKV